MLLEAQGYLPVSFVLKNGSGDLFKQGPFDVIILGQSVADVEKKRLVEALRKCSSAPIISVPSEAGEPNDGADVHAEPDPEGLLSVIAGLVHDGKCRGSDRLRVMERGDPITTPAGAASVDSPKRKIHRSPHNPTAPKIPY